MRAASTVRYRIVAALLVVVAVSAAPACGIGHGRSTASCGPDQRIIAEGTPVQTRAMAVFRAAWLAHCPDRVFSYLPATPADAVSRFVNGDADLAAVHSPLAPEELQRTRSRCGGAPAVHLPMVLRGMSLPYNVPGAARLTLTGRLIEKIFTGAVTRWTDPEIVAVNGGVPLPELPITVVLQDGDSVLTEDFTAYLRAYSSTADVVPTPRAVRVGNDAVLQTIARTPGAIGLVPYQPGTAPLPSVLIDSGQGPVGPSAESAMLAVDGTEFAQTGDDLVLAMDTLYRTREPGGYPLVGVSYDVVCLTGYDRTTAATVRSFLHTAATVDRAAIGAAGYLPLPDFLKDRILDVAGAVE